MISIRRKLQSVLVANRGEIAIRIFRSCRELGLATVAVYSDADAASAHVAAADRALRIGPATPLASYLNVDAVIAAATAAHADAVHPGYGFLAEDPRLPEACAAAGFTFVGPSAASMRALGDKRAAKRLAAEVGLPVVPGVAGSDQSTDALVAAASDLGFPLLIKAAAGGGGRGMRVVYAAEDVASAIERARSEASAAFGDGSLLLERYIQAARHIEVQVVSDHAGNVTHLWERDCSVQRRYQKVIEEAPAPGLDPALRRVMCDGAVALVKAAGYEGVATVEMIVDRTGAHYFLEVNTRLQVEHAVTEAVYGVDLVVVQLRIARGELLSDVLPAAPLASRCFAVEARLCAEDPDNDFLPQPGTAHQVEFPSGPGLRVESALRAHDAISIHYDPMLGKLIATGPTRQDAARLLAWAVERTWLPGVVDNRAFLVRALRHPRFVAGDVTTSFVSDEWDALRPPPLSDADAHAAALVAALAATGERAARGPLPTLRPRWRNVSVPPLAARYRVDGKDVELTYEVVDRDRVDVAGVDGPATVGFAADGPGWLALQDAHGVRRRFRWFRAGETTWVDVDGHCARVEEVARLPDAAAVAVGGAHKAPMPGRVVQVLVAVGDDVTAGQALLAVEAMKMQHVVRAAVAGRVDRIVAVGTLVDVDQPLAVIAAVG